MRAAAGLGEREARGRIAFVLRRQQGEVWATGSPAAGQAQEQGGAEVDIEGVQVELVREEVDEAEAEVGEGGGVGEE